MPTISLFEQNRVPGHDPGGKSRFKMLPGVTGAAYISEDQKHRLWLSRHWGSAGRYLAFLGLNPSEANHRYDDPTIRKDITFAQREGFDGLYKLNICTFRATNWRVLLRDDVVPVHAESGHILRKVTGRCSKVVIAFGAIHRDLYPFAKLALEQITQSKPDLWCFGTTKYGHPRHTLYLSSLTPLVPYKMSRVYG